MKSCSEPRAFPANSGAIRLISRPRFQTIGLVQQQTRSIMPTNPIPLAYSVAEACRATSLGKTRIYQLINAGQLSARKVGKRTLISAESLRRLIAGEG
jgi:excisionase family DNA binding protein